jgi:hypothetical protein
LEQYQQQQLLRVRNLRLRKNIDLHKQISSPTKLPATNPSELKGEATTDISTVRHTSPALSTGFPLAVEGEGPCCELAAKNFLLDDPPFKWSIVEVAGISTGSLGIRGGRLDR